MSNFVGIPPFSNPLWVAMETMHFHIVHINMFLRTTLFRTQGVPMVNFAPMKIVLGMQGNLNWMRGYTHNALYSPRQKISIFSELCKNKKNCVSEIFCEVWYKLFYISVIKQ